MPELSADALARFEREVTDEFVDCLLKYALRRTRSRSWRGIWDGHLPEGKEAVDVVYEAIDDVLLGRREWDPVANPDLLHFMRSVVNSKISHLLEGAENRYEHLAPPAVEGEQTDYFDTIKNDGALPADILLRIKEDEERNSDMLLRLIDFLSSEPLLQKIVECLLDGVEKRAEIARMAGVTEKDITNAQKRLDRRLADFREANKHDNPFIAPR